MSASVGGGSSPVIIESAHWESGSEPCNSARSSASLASLAATAALIRARWAKMLSTISTFSSAHGVAGGTRCPWLQEARQALRGHAAAPRRPEPPLALKRMCKKYDNPH